MISNRRRRAAMALVVLATIIGFFAVFAVWAKRQVLETDTWTKTSTELLSDPDVQDALSAFMVDSLYSSVDVEANVKSALPPQAQGLAGPAAAGLRQLADRAAHQALTRPRVQRLWEEANSRAHAAFINVVEGTDNVSTGNGTVTLDLGSIVEQVGTNAGVDVAGKVPPQFAQIELLRSDQLSLVQDLINLLRTLSIILPLLALALYGAAIYVGRGRRRETLRACGVGFIAIGFVVLVARSVAGNFVVDSLASTDGVKPAVESVWEIATSLLRDGGIAMIGYGVVIVLGAWLAGATSAARSLRREITPILRERAYLYSVIILIVLLTLWWSPTEGTKRLIPSLVLIALLVAGFEALRRQAIRDFPEETMEAAGARWEQRLSARRRRRAAADLPASAEVTGQERLAALERLARLKEQGVLDAAEFQQEKQRLLAASPE